MKKAVISSILLLATSSFASTTMCFKESHSSMATIESIALDGGECAGKYSINDMKAKGWSVDDIKITQTPKGMSFIYILKSPDHAKIAPMVAGGAVAGGSISQEQMEANIMAKLEAKKVAEEKAKVEQEIKEAKIDAQGIYTNQCQNCHGAKGEVRKGNSKLKDLTIEQMEEALKDYKLGVGEKASSVYGPSHINFLNDKTIKGIKAYLDSIQ
ncbi:c-type cytochrome [Aliarcobacter cibarius]|uniref:Cytochrome c n=1 Tax=Aliarcobacter cibarius TaxID=255507 RepID=A0A5J6RI50_9BACT|nr:c-type cytochrome [Aliarcobacter cibarius]QEZ88428.1 hypothetical protein ACIB15232_0233 [Aliarcobacter cibarius]QKJ26439.1 hypothetical protein ACBT_0475 [Aliarcobacter cibarius]TLT01926.1 cytochrome c [Aliarcobacter cibarius]TLT02261.1 cytochrome c [Aliarcobacter cibarius]TLT04692.1 cytochrome c [Aliarcobacter cibarius]